MENDARSESQPLSAIGEGFRRRFELVPALTDALKDETYRLRHSVYSEDLGFEPQRPDGREIDKYDAHATGLLIRHLPSREFIGCARLIHPNPDALSDPLPFERTCGSGLDREVVDASPRSQIAEVSRLAVISKFRRRKGEASVPAPLGENDLAGGPTPRFPYILLGLYLGIIAVSELQGIKKLFVLTEPRLALHLTKVGFELVQVGAPVEHRGTRIPSMMTVSQLVTEMKPYLRPVYEVIRRQVFDQSGVLAKEGAPVC